MNLTTVQLKKMIKEELMKEPKIWSQDSAADMRLIYQYQFYISQLVAKYIDIPNEEEHSAGEALKRAQHELVTSYNILLTIDKKKRGKK